jgi:hypothetical protein
MPESSFRWVLDPGSEAGMTFGSEAGMTFGSEAGMTFGSEAGMTFFRLNDG